MLLQGKIDQTGYVKLFKSRLEHKGLDGVSSCRAEAEDAMKAAGWQPPQKGERKMNAAISWSARRPITS